MSDNQEGVNQFTAEATTDHALNATQTAQEGGEAQREEPLPEDDDDFDAEKARRTIKRVREELRAAKADRTPQSEKDAAAITKLRRQLADLEGKASGAEEATQKLSALEGENLRLRIAVKHGLPESLVKRLAGNTEEEILQDAEELMELFGSKKPPTQQPREKLRSPGDPSGSADIDVEQVVRRVFEN